jgi:hypothetical protein
MVNKLCSSVLLEIKIKNARKVSGVGGMVRVEKGKGGGRGKWRGGEGLKGQEKCALLLPTSSAPNLAVRPLGPRIMNLALLLRPFSD